MKKNILLAVMLLVLSVGHSQKSDTLYIFIKGKFRVGNIHIEKNGKSVFDSDRKISFRKKESFYFELPITNLDEEHIFVQIGRNKEFHLITRMEYNYLMIERDENKRTFITYWDRWAHKR